jgi:Flp pilus assembly protein CpaB
VVQVGTGAGLQIEPGELVDVLASYQGNPQAIGAARKNRVEIVVPSVRVLTLEPATGSGNGSVPVVLSVTPEEQQQILYAQSFATKLIVTKVAPGSTPETPPIYSPSQ